MTKKADLTKKGGSNIYRYMDAGIRGKGEIKTPEKGEMKTPEKGDNRKDESGRKVKAEEKQEPQERDSAKRAV